MRFKTHSGSEYEIVNHPAGRVIRRINDHASKRADGIFVRLVNDPVIEVGWPARLVMASLAEYGEDDYGTPVHGVSPYTFRTTSPVIEIEEDK